jgi:hypothetical protein
VDGIFMKVPFHGFGAGMESVKGRSPSIGRIGPLLATGIALVSRVRKMAAPAMTTGHIAFVGHPFPVTGFLIAMLIELGAGLLRMCGRRP